VFNTEHNGHPVVAEHGSPGSRLGPKPDRNILEETGVRLYNYDRPGYGLSTPNPGRLPVDSRRNVAAICSYFGLKRIASLGRSAGVEHALSAYSLPEVERIALLAGSAPEEAVLAAHALRDLQKQTLHLSRKRQKQSGQGLMSSSRKCKKSRNIFSIRT